MRPRHAVLFRYRLFHDLLHEVVVAVRFEHGYVDAGHLLEVSFVFEDSPLSLDDFGVVREVAVDVGGVLSGP